MRVLAITQIWPNSKEPLSSPFNVQQFKALKARCDLEVLAAVVQFPGAKLTGQLPRAALLADLPREETIAGIRTHYLRQAYVPKVGVPIAVPLYIASMHPWRRLIKSADVLLGTWAYPDGASTALVASALGIPCVIKVHGSDLNVIAKRKTVRAVLRQVLPRADALVTVSRALGQELEDLGVQKDKVHLVANGVDTEIFAPADKRAARRELGIEEDGPLVLFVGRLEAQKGVRELVEAWTIVRKDHPNARLVMIGEKLDSETIARAEREHGDRIVMPGPRPLREVARWMAACDLFTLPSWAEGTPNVVLEALASGRPVVASDVGGIPDVMANRASGAMVPAKDACALGNALARALSHEWDAESVRKTGPGSWDASGAKLFDVLASVARK